MPEALSYQPPYQAPYPRIPLEGLKGREGHAYVPDPDLIAAANAALALGLPLLLTGEAGCGKTDFAFAATGALAGADGAKPLECYVRSDSRARDLLYHYDAIRRFGDAQHGGEEGKRRAQSPRPYVKLQPLGQALMSPKRRVVLIDEIDKAPRDLPNDLLRELDQGHFEIQEIPAQDGAGDGPVDLEDPSTYRHQMKRPNPDQKPFIVITSNVERQLPDPFLRRSVFFHIPFPGDDDLRTILEARFPRSTAEPLFRDRVLEIFGALRQMRPLTKKPTTSELINWTEALTTIFDSEGVRRALEPFAGHRLRDQPRDLPWKALPALSCLIKLREDLERLGVTA